MKTNFSPERVQRTEIGNHLFLTHTVTMVAVTIDGKEKDFRIFHKGHEIGRGWLDHGLHYRYGDRIPSDVDHIVEEILKEEFYNDFSEPEEWMALDVDGRGPSCPLSMWARTE